MPFAMPAPAPNGRNDANNTLRDCLTSAAGGRGGALALRPEAALPHRLQADQALMEHVDGPHDFGDELFPCVRQGRELREQVLHLALLVKDVGGDLAREHLRKIGDELGQLAGRVGMQVVDDCERCIWSRPCYDIPLDLP